MAELITGDNLIILFQVIMIDLVLAGDNAIVVGMAASSVSADMRQKVIFWGIATAVILRVAFAAVTTKLLSIPGLTLAGGVLLFIVCWKMYRDLKKQTHPDTSNSNTTSGATNKSGSQSLYSAILQIALADVSMSLDNVLAVAGAARDNTIILIIGLLLAVILMAVAANWVAKLLSRYRWIGYVGLAIIVYVAAEMTWRGGEELMQLMAPS